MHFAYPPRKSSNPPPFRPRSSKLPTLRRSRLKTVALVLLGFIGILYLLSGSKGTGPYREHVPSGDPPVVIVTVIDPVLYKAPYLETIKDNRERYSAKHGYAALVVRSFDYNTRGAPQSWSKIMAMRHALSLYPEAKYFWYLDQHSYIMDSTKSLEEQVMQPRKLESLMIKDFPVVPPDSIIKTFAHLSGDAVDLVLAHDKEGLLGNSFVVRNGDWAKFFLETWFDPLYRSYNFQKAEKHALEHIVQWHPTILSKLALVPQRSLASYTRSNLGDLYQEGDFVVMFTGCTRTGQQSCEAEASHYREKWVSTFGKA